MPTRLEVHNQGLYALRRDPAIRADLERRGRAILNACGGEAEGYALSSGQGARNPQGRWRVGVVTTTNGAIRDNATNNTLVRALSAGR